MKTIRLEKHDDSIKVFDILYNEICLVTESGLILKESTIHKYELDQIYTVLNNFWLFYNNIK